MKRSLLTVLLVVMIALAGCSALTGGQDTADTGTDLPDEDVEVSSDSASATGVNHTLRIEASDATVGEEWTAIGATYPRENFTVDAADHDAVLLGVDTDDDGELDRSFNETHVSGVNTNEFTFDITLDTGYTFEEGDVAVVGYPSISNPDEPGSYEAQVRLNEDQQANATITIE